MLEEEGDARQYVKAFIPRHAHAMISTQREWSIGVYGSISI